MFEMIYYGLGFLMLFVVLIITYKFIKNYKITKQKELMAALLMMIFFLPGLLFFSVLFILELIYNYNLEISNEFSIFLTYGFIPMVSISWLYCFIKIIYPNSIKVKIFFYVFIVISIVYEIALITLLLLSQDIGIIITQDNPVLISYRLFAELVSVIAVLILAYKSIKSKDTILQFRGIFLIIGFILAGIGLFFDTGIFDGSIEQIIGRILIIVGFAFIYFGFFISENKKIFKFLCRVFSIEIE